MESELQKQLCENPEEEESQINTKIDDFLLKLNRDPPPQGYLPHESGGGFAQVFEEARKEQDDISMFAVKGQVKDYVNTGGPVIAKQEPPEVKPIQLLQGSEQDIMLERIDQSVLIQKHLELLQSTIDSKFFNHDRTIRISVTIGTLGGNCWDQRLSYQMLCQREFTSDYGMENYLRVYIQIFGEEIKIRREPGLDIVIDIMTLQNNDKLILITKEDLPEYMKRAKKLSYPASLLLANKRGRLRKSGMLGQAMDELFPSDQEVGSQIGVEDGLKEVTNESSDDSSETGIKTIKRQARQLQQDLEGMSGGKKKNKKDKRNIQKKKEPLGITPIVDTIRQDYKPTFGNTQDQRETITVVQTPGFEDFKQLEPRTKEELFNDLERMAENKNFRILPYSNDHNTSTSKTLYYCCYKQKASSKKGNQCAFLLVYRKIHSEPFFKLIRSKDHHNHELNLEYERRSESMAHLMIGDDVKDEVTEKVEPEIKNEQENVTIPNERGLTLRFEDEFKEALRRDEHIDVDKKKKKKKRRESSSNSSDSSEKKKKKKKNKKKKNR